MGKCRFCGDEAGFLRSTHPRCKKDHRQGLNDITASVQTFFYNGGGDLNNLDSQLESIARNSGVNGSEKLIQIVVGWRYSASNAFEDGLLSSDEESTLASIKNYYSLIDDDLDKDGSLSRVAKGATLRQVCEGELPENMIVESHPFNLQKSEKLIWMFDNVDYYEHKTRSEYRGASKGISVRVGKGVYVRAGAFKGRKVEKTKKERMDTGLLGITNKHIYFSGSSKKFRINYNKIVTLEPFSDGIGVQRDAQSATPQIFITQDGWFTYNLTSNLAKL